MMNAKAEAKEKAKEKSNLTRLKYDTGVMNKKRNESYI